MVDLGKRLPKANDIALGNGNLKGKVSCLASPNSRIKLIKVDFLTA